MILFSVLIWKNSNFNDTPFFSINKFTSMVLIYILRYLSFIDFYAEVRNAESTQSLYQINVYNKAGQ
ncbi:unknown [Bacteroides sp. CAG:462]|nr:unknown [Bacteroides sp. CAG:462]